MTPEPQPYRRRIALVTHGFDFGGGVRTVARWLAGQLEAQGRYAVDVHDLATWRCDAASRRLLSPRSWVRPSVRALRTDGSRCTYWGANAVELEFMRYRPRRELTSALR